MAVAWDWSFQPWVRLLRSADGFNQPGVSVCETVVRSTLPTLGYGGASREQCAPDAS